MFLSHVQAVCVLSLHGRESPFGNGAGDTTVTISPTNDSASSDLSTPTHVLTLVICEKSTVWLCNAPTMKNEKKILSYLLDMQFTDHSEVVKNV